MTDDTGSGARTDESIDAWVLLASGPTLGVPWRGKSLLTIVGMLDAIERSYPTASEFDAAIGRLNARGLLSVRKDRIHLTRQGRTLLRKTRGGRGWFPQWHRLESEFAQSPAPEDCKRLLLSDGAFERAMEEYFKRAKYA